MRYGVQNSYLKASWQVGICITMGMLIEIQESVSFYYHSGGGGGGGLLGKSHLLFFSGFQCQSTVDRKLKYPYYSMFLYWYSGRW